MPDPTDFYLNQLSVLVGGRITTLARTEPDEEGNVFFGLVITLPEGKEKTLLFLRDDEGNGPGSFEIQ